MHTWSLESAFIKAYSAAAVAVQGLFDAAHTVERVTRPVRRDVRDGAEQLADKEAEEDVAEPPCRLLAALDCDCPSCRQAAEITIPPLEDDQLAMRLGLVPDKRPGQHNSSDHLCVYSTPDDLDESAVCGVCRPVRDIVEQMIEERFGGQVDKADKLDAEMWRAVVDMYSKMDHPQSTPAASAAGSSSPAACDIPPVARRGVPPWSELADRMVEHLPSAKVQDGIDSAASTFPQHTRKHLK